MKRLKGIAKNASAVIVSVIVSFFLVFMTVYGATTISSNITTGGNLTVTGTSNLTGLLTFVYASGTGMSLTENLMVGGKATTTGSSGNFATAGTLTVTGLSTLGYASTTGISLTGNLMANGMATTTGLSGNIATQGKLGVGTSTPATEISALGSATTTVYAHSSGTGVGSCLQLMGTNGTIYRMYVGGSDVATTTFNGRTAIIALFEAGSCK